jgi:hypothetical protein
MRLSFKPHCHAFVAFSLRDFRVKARPQERLRLTRVNCVAEKMFWEYGKRPNKEMA